MIEHDDLLMDEVKEYIKRKMISEGIFHARAPLMAISTQNILFYKYPSKLRERGMYELIQNNYIEKNIIVLYRNVLKNDPDDTIYDYANIKIPFIFFNIDTIERVSCEKRVTELASYEKKLTLELKSFSGKTDSFVISKEEYDDILSHLRLLERYDILLKIGV